MKTLTVLVLFYASLSAISGEPVEVLGANRASSTPITPAYVNLLAEEMRTNHPALAAARSRTNAAGANAASVRVWDDPMIELGGLVAEQSMRAEDGDLIYGIEQKLPLFGKATQARRVARAELATETTSADLAFQTLRRDLAKAAFRTALRDESIALGEQDLAWLETLTATMESRYRAGQSMLAEVLQVQNERSRRAAQLATERELLTHEHLTLNRFLNRRETTVWPRFELPPLAAVVPYSEPVVNFALKYEPQIAVLQKEIDQAEAAVEQTRRDRYPDVSLGLEGRNYTGNGEFRQSMVGFRMSVPGFNRGKYRAAITRDESRIAALRHELENYRQGVRQEVHLLAVRIGAARREALLYQDEIVPRSESALASARAGWESGQTLFREVLETRRMLVEARLMRARAVAEQYEMLSELVLCCGLGDLEALEMLASGAGLENKTNAN